MELKALFRLLIYFIMPYLIGTMCKPHIFLCVLIVVVYLLIVGYIDYKLS